VAKALGLHPGPQRGPSGTRNLNPDGSAGGPGTRDTHDAKTVTQLQRARYWRVRVKAGFPV
jgi:hypothetical protein